MISRAWSAIKNGNDVEALKRRVSELEMAFKEETVFNCELEEKLANAEELAEHRRIELIKLRGTLFRTREELNKTREKMMRLYSVSDL